MSLIEMVLHISDTSVTNCGVITYGMGRGGVKKAENNMNLETFGPAVCWFVGTRDQINNSGGPFSGTFQGICDDVNVNICE